MVDALQARLGGAHHRGDPVLRLRAAGPAAARGARPITAKVVANMIGGAGVDRVLTMDLHADQIQGFFDVPVDNIYASPVLLGDVWKQKYENLIVVSPDVGGVVRARAIAKRLETRTSRSSTSGARSANESQVMNIIGDVRGRHLRDRGRHRRHRGDAVPGGAGAEGRRRGRACSPTARTPCCRARRWSGSPSRRSTSWS